MPSVAQRVDDLNAGAYWSQAGIGTVWDTYPTSENALVNPSMFQGQLGGGGGAAFEYPRPYALDSDGYWFDRVTDGSLGGAHMAHDDEAAEFTITGAAESVSTYPQPADVGTPGDVHMSGTGGWIQFFSSIAGTPLSALVGQTFTFEVDLKLVAIGGATADADLRAIVYFVDNGGGGLATPVSISLAAGGTVAPWSAGGQGAWQRLRVSATIPVGTARARIRADARIFLNGHTFATAPTVTARARRAVARIGTTAPWVPPVTQAGSTVVMAVTAKTDDAADINDPAGWTLVHAGATSLNGFTALKVWKIENASPRSGAELVTFAAAFDADIMLREIADGGTATNVGAGAAGNSNTHSTGSLAAAMTAEEVVLGFIGARGSATATPQGTYDDSRAITSANPTVADRMTLRSFDVVRSTGSTGWTQTLGANRPYAGVVLSVVGGAGGAAVDAEITSALPTLTQAATASAAVAGPATSTLPTLTQSASGAAAVAAEATSTLQALTQAATAEAAASAAGESTLPALGQTATATAAVVAAGDSTLPALTQAADGTVETEGATAVSVLPALTQQAAATVAVRGDGASTLPGLVSGALGAASVEATTSSLLPALAQSAEAALAVVAAATSTLPPVGQQAAGSVDADIAATVVSLLPALAQAAVGGRPGFVVQVPAAATVTAGPAPSAAVTAAAAPSATVR